MRRPLPSISTLALLLATGATACLFKADLPDLEGRPCGPGKTCVAGYLCDAGLCKTTSIGALCDFVEDDCEVGLCRFSVATDDFCTVACASSSECPAGFRCAEGDVALPGTRVCLPAAEVPEGAVGSLGVGVDCTSASDCQSNLCDRGICTDTCQHQRACEGAPIPLDCRVINVGGRVEARCARPIAGDGQGAACLDSTTCSRAACVGDSTGGSPICTEPCCSTSDCPVDTVCWMVTWTGWTPADGQARSCIPWSPSGAASFGEPCGSDSDCTTGTCWLDPNTSIRACTDLCCSDADCPTSYRCEPQPYNLDSEPGEDSHIPVCVTRP